MRIGVVFPQTEIGNDPSVIRDFAQAVEALGFNHLVAYDHVLGATHDREPRLTGPYTEQTPFHEVFVLFGYLAALTTRIELMTGVLILPQRQTALVAKQAAQIDVLSKGRLRLGVGTGWNYVEYDSLNENFHNRGKREEEQITVLRKLWTEQVVDFKGKYHTIDRAGIQPMPTRNIPIWLGGGMDDRVLRRAAKYGDGMFPLWGANEDGRAALEKLRGYVADEGRDPATFGIEAQVPYQAGPENWNKHAETWKDLGATYICVRTMNAGLTTPQEHIDAIRRYAEEAGTSR